MTTSMCADTRKRATSTRRWSSILNQVDRFNLSIDVIDRVPRLSSIGAHVKEWLKGQIIDSIAYAHAEGIDKEEIRNWKWPGQA